MESGSLSEVGSVFKINQGQVLFGGVRLPLSIATTPATFRNRHEQQKRYQAS